ncbi:hypothetical protein EXIGLDRAFT_725915 [Exidia glandulosa HHB12029]|uniref:Peptidase M20 domain-containing protein 2 n=1 Tax=Exidia glandulosa HHB12029 TaxID=1314781 RepID=A0A165MIE3_EXIGL|nr:hypothetical protein EXIGLDRAFT_725915 [Exidia glandulosa HHB12029]
MVARSALLAVLVSSARAAAAVTIAEADLQAFLVNASATLYPPVKTLSQKIWNLHEISLMEVQSAALVASHFESRASEGWKVTRDAYNQPTGLEVDWENRPAGSPATLPTIGILAEYDALVGVGHACGHNLIALNGILVASLVRAAVLHYNIPAAIRLIGTPDEEFTGGKIRMYQAGAFKKGDIWMLAHPTVANAIQPMGARHTAVLAITGTDHYNAIFKAYQALVAVVDLSGKLPGTASVAVPTENVGAYESNVVQTEIKLGVVGDIAVVNSTIAQAWASKAAFSAVAWTISKDSTGVVLDITGPGGHSSEGTLGALALSVETFRLLSTNQPTYKYYLPSNTTVTELDLSISVRSRYTSDMSAVENAVIAATKPYYTRISWDTIMLALEVTPYLGQRVATIYGEAAFNESFPITNSAPAATDAGWIQQPVVDANSAAHTFLSESVPVLHANYGICPNATGAGCPFNHEGPFATLANAELGYQKTEKMARVEAQIAVELLADPAKMAQARALVK